LVFVDYKTANAGIEHAPKSYFSAVPNTVLVNKEPKQEKPPPEWRGFDTVPLPVLEWNATRLYYRVFVTAFEYHIEQKQPVPIVWRGGGQSTVSWDRYRDITFDDPGLGGPRVGYYHIDDDILPNFKLSQY